MNEIVNVKVNYSLGEIQQNLKEVAASVRKYCDDFKGVVVTEDTVADGKQMLANIRKEKKYLDDQRKEIKKAWNAPYLEFEKQVKEVTALYDEPINMINGQIQELEEQRKAKKRETINEIWTTAKIPEELQGWFSLSELYNPRWENATFKDKDIEQEISDKVAMLKMAYDTVRSLHHPYEEDGLKVLKESKDLQSAMACMTNLMEQERRIMEQKRLQEEEEKRRREEEKRRQEEEARKQLETPPEPEPWFFPEGIEPVQPLPEPLHEWQGEPVPPMEEMPAPEFSNLEVDDHVSMTIYEVTINVFEDDLVDLKKLLDEKQYIYSVKEVF